MSKPYFQQVPDLLYTDRSSGNKSISSYSKVKNLFKRAKLRTDIYSDLTFFTKYQIKGDERPDNVAEKFYDDSTLDWVILLANNITNIQTEWPLSEYSYNNFLMDKYGTEEKLQEVNHYECTGVKNSEGAVMAQQGLTVEKDYSVTYLDPDSNIGKVTITNATETITNLAYENKIQDAKRNIYVLKRQYLNTIFNDLSRAMKYKKGSTQYISGTLKKTENIRLYS
tara:strand:+ start:1464 stop:2138 length:675 start_codon:yes stop_codon:yes gene_type:complete